MTIKCNLIIDSCGDLTREMVDAQEGLYCLQFPYIDDDGEHLDDLYRTITPKQFYDGMRHGNLPHTAQIPMPAIQAAIDWAIEQDKPTVWLAFSSGLSGTFNTIEMMVDAAKEEHPDLELHLVDTKLASIAEGFLDLEAIRQRDRGLSAAELADWAREALWFVNCGFMVDDLNALKHGGRIPASVAFAGSKLDVKVLLAFDLDGKLAMTGVARGRKKGIRALSDLYLKGHDKAALSNTVFFGNADCEKDVERLKDLVIKGDAGIAPVDSSIGPVIGSHVGPGMLAIVYWGADRRHGASVADRIANRLKG